LEREINSGKLQLSREDIELLTQLYNSEIYWTDYNLGILFNYLKNNNLYDNTWIILTADHGEMIYEHNKIGHPNSVLNEELLHIPLIFKLPNQKGDAKVMDELTSIIDIMPSILDYLDIESEQPLMGKSVIDLIDQTWIKKFFSKYFRKDKTVIVSEGRNRSVQIRSEKYKYIEQQNLELGSVTYNLFDLKKDPNEKVNIFDSKQNTVKKFQKKLSIWKELTQSYYVKAKKREIKKDDLERLKALGYIK
ncbi:MAG: sulfatase-like hydrolase/transferase, partial [Candidatus Aminicenantes bacterium]